MPKSSLKDGYIALNDEYYKLKSPLYARYISPLTGKVNIGDASLDNQVNLNTWSIKDQRGGLGVSEMDESVHSDRYWWGDCITDHMGHIFLPRLATAITKLPISPTGHVDGAAAWSTETNAYDIDLSTTAQCILGDAGDTDFLELTHSEITIDGIILYYHNGAVINVDIDSFYGAAWHHEYDAAISTENAYVEIAFAAPVTVTAIRISFELDGADTVHLHELFMVQSTGGNTTTVDAVNYNGELYWAKAAILYKLNSNGDMFIPVTSVAATITKLIVSEDNSLYIFCGDGTNYYYMTTAEAVTQTNVANANWGIHWDAKLFKWATDGSGAYATDPSSATPTWTALTASLNDIVGQIERFEIGKDADGNDVIYCATNGRLKVLDFGNDIWLDSALKLPNHPNGGKGFTYWHDGHYISYGLGIKRYITGSTATISETGLNRDDGLPSEYNGEITFLLGEDASDNMFALVDASPTSGNSKSGLYAFNGRSWKCWWIDTSNNGAMILAIISSAYGYRIWWDVGDVIYYIDLHRGLQNVGQLIGTQIFAASGIHISPWFDAGTQAFDKLLARVISWAKLVTTTETIKIYYRINKATTDIDLDFSGGSWTLLVSLDTSGENGQVKTTLASGAGLVYESIQFRIDLARDTTTTLTPDLQGLLSAFQVLTGADGYWEYVFTLLCEDAAGGKRTRAKDANIKTALELGTLVPIIFDNSGTTHYCRLQLLNAVKQTGEHFNNEYSLQATEV